MTKEPMIAAPADAPVTCGHGCHCLTQCGDTYDHSGTDKPPKVDADAPVAEPVALNALKLIATAAASEHQAEYMRGLARAALRKVGAECITAIESAAPSAAEPECLGAIRKALDPRDRFKPTPGEWVADGRKGWVHPNTVVRTSDSREEGGHDIVRVHADFNCTVGKSEYEWANATFVAACSPQNIRAMLGYIDNLQAALIGQQHSAEPAVLTLDQYKAAMLKLKVKPGSLLEGDGDSLWQISTVREKAVLWLAFKNWYRPAPQAPAEPAPVLDGWRMVCGDWRDERVAIHGPQGHIVSGLTTEQAAALIAAHGGQAQGEAS